MISARSKGSEMSAAIICWIRLCWAKGSSTGWKDNVSIAFFAFYGLRKLQIINQIFTLKVLKVNHIKFFRLFPYSRLKLQSQAFLLGRAVLGASGALAALQAGALPFLRFNILTRFRKLIKNFQIGLNKNF